MPKQPKPEAEPEAHQNAVAALKADHRKVEEMFKKFKEHTHGSDETGESNLVHQICNELIVHTLLEEEIFYPACRDKGVDEKALNEAQVEHDGAKVLITDLLSASPDDAFYDAKVTVLEEYIKHHVHEEEQARSGLFALAIKAGVDMSALGDELAARKKQLNAQSKKTLTAPKLKALNFETRGHSSDEADDAEQKPARTSAKAGKKPSKQAKAKSSEKESSMQRDSRGRGGWTRHQDDESDARREPNYRSTRGYDEHDEDYPAGRQRTGEGRNNQAWDSGDGYPSDDRQNRGFGARGRQSQHDEDRHEGRYDRPQARDNSDSHWDNERGGRNPNRTSTAQRQHRPSQYDEQEHRRSFRDEFEDHGRDGRHGSQRSYEDDQRASRSSWSGGNRMRNHSQTQGGHGGQFRGASRGGVGSRNGARSDR